jgi:predicted nucleic acid-binding protein
MKKAFIDTNVFLYADDAGTPRKQKTATALLRGASRTHTLVLSTQVIQEYYVNALNKLGLTPEHARDRVDDLSQLEVVTVRLELILAAIDLHQLRRISFWDALVVKAASSVRCEVLYTEDLQDGQVLDGVRVENPFLAGT